MARPCYRRRLVIPGMRDPPSLEASDWSNKKVACRRTLRQRMKLPLVDTDDSVQSNLNSNARPGTCAYIRTEWEDDSRTCLKGSSTGRRRYLSFGSDQVAQRFAKKNGNDSIAMSKHDGGNTTAWPRRTSGADTSPLVQEFWATKRIDVA